MSFSPKNELVHNRSLKVQTLSIPLVVVGNVATGSVSLTSDEPGVLALQSAGVDQLTAALDANETATFTGATLSDANGVFQALIKVREPVKKVLSVQLVNRVTGTMEPAFLGSATGITTGTGGGSSIMVKVDSATSIATANTIDACLIVQYETVI